jgi:hypothetical protein
MNEKVKISIDRRESFQEITSTTPIIIVLPSGKEFVIRYIGHIDTLEINKSHHGIDGKSAITIESSYPNEIIIK